ncbi:MAG: Hpt domain-containing protein, partial [Magnetococcales bacterium]|nr:Hpt domain-containing protein [Magnetococcales bacterium]
MRPEPQRMGAVEEAESPEKRERTAFPEIDWQSGIRRWGGEAAHWKALSGFIRRHAGDGALARAALLAGDPEGARASIHGLKGGAGVVAAVELEQAAWDLDGLLGAEVCPIAERSGELT